MIRAGVAKEIGVDYPVEVIAVASHDTASAVYATVSGDDAASTAWLVRALGRSSVSTFRPVLTEEARQAGFTNEGGAGGKICFLQNITGLWMLQRLMAAWSSRGRGIDIVELVKLAEAAEIDTVVDVDDPVFASAEKMDVVLADYCRRHGMREPMTQGEAARVVIQSLARRYARGIVNLNTFLPQPVTKLRIMGGGSRNRLLNRHTAEYAGIEVEAADVEATAIGNILVQAVADGAVTGRGDIKEIL